MTLILGWTDDRILRRGQGSVEPVYDHSGINVDLVYKHTLEWGENDLTLTLAGRNLGGAVYEEYQTYARGRNEVDRYPRGQVFSASLAAEF